MPAAEEFGLLLQDRVRAFRARNVAKIAAKAEKKLAEVSGTANAHAQPRIVGMILEQGSWVEQGEVQEMWAGLLASSCAEDGGDDSNLMFVDLLARLTASQARLLDSICRVAKKAVAPNGLILPTDAVFMDEEALRSITGVTDLHRLDRELDHLRSLDLIFGGVHPLADVLQASVQPTPLALQMFARLNGHRGNPADFYGLESPKRKSSEGA